MTLPFFYAADLKKGMLILDEDTSKHITGVLRMKTGEQLQLTDGKGRKGKATIVDDNRKKAGVQIFEIEEQQQDVKRITIAISLVKNLSRFDWFLEKVTEISVSEIIPMICERTEREKFRMDRMQNILISAMLQSQQTWLPQLQEPVAFETVVTNADQQQKFIAHCSAIEKRRLATSAIHYQSSIILIGPEGDFTEKEIQFALQNNFAPVSLGDTRLRTETAAIVAATLLINA